jgi:hypothetical protein
VYTVFNLNKNKRRNKKVLPRDRNPKNIFFEKREKKTKEEQQKRRTDKTEEKKKKKKTKKTKKKKKTRESATKHTFFLHFIYLDSSLSFSQ